MTTARQSTRWLAAELVVVVLGILIALQLEALREARQDRIAEVDGLQSVLEDLRSDLIGLEGFANRVDAQGYAVRRLGLHFDGTATITADSLLLVYEESVRARFWQPDAASYWGMRDSGRLTLISDGALRSELVDYFDGYEPYLSELGRMLRGATGDWRSVTTADFVATSGGTSLRDPFSWSLATPVDRVPSHPEARGRLGDLIRWTSLVRDQLDVAFGRHAQLKGRIEAHLDSL